MGVFGVGSWVDPAGEICHLVWVKGEVKWEGREGVHPWAAAGVDGWSRGSSSSAHSHNRNFIKEPYTMHRSTPASYSSAPPTGLYTLFCSHSHVLSGVMMGLMHPLHSRYPTTKSMSHIEISIEDYAHKLQVSWYLPYHTTTPVLFWGYQTHIGRGWIRMSHQSLIAMIQLLLLPKVHFDMQNYWQRV